MKHGIKRAICSALAAVMMLGCTIGPGRLAASAAAPESAPMDVWVQNSADRAFESSVKPDAAAEQISLYAARNEYEAAQILVRANSALTDVVLTASALTGADGAVLGAENIALYREYSNEAEVPGDVEPTPDGSNRYTDALLPNEKTAVAAGLTQPYWVRIHVPTGQKPGTYTGTVTVSAKEGSFEVPVSLKVYDVTLPNTNEGSFKMLNWFGSAGCDFGALESSVPGQYDVEMYDANWWKVMESFARDLAIHRNNVIFLDSMALLMPGTRITENSTPENEFVTDANGVMPAGKYLLDWNTFDRLVQIFIDAGAFQYLYNPGSFLSMDRSTKVTKLWVLEEVGGRMTRVEKPIYLDQAKGIVDPAIEAYVQTYFTALRTHMQEKFPQYLDKVYISAQDEPFDKEQIKAANWFYAAVKKAYPEVMSNEAHSRFWNTLTETSTLCPILDVYENNQNYYQEQRAAGRELWYYTCIGPQGDYLNRFIPYHLIKTRLIPWYVYQIGGTGYLHWGYCWWRTSEVFDSKQTGDEWLVRPDKANYDVFTSVRNEAQLDGIEDYELLKLLEKKNAKAAKSVADTMIQSATVYPRSGESAQQAHKMLLDLLSGAETQPISVPFFADRFENGYDAAWHRNGGSWKVRDGGYCFTGAAGNGQGSTTLRSQTLRNGSIEVTMHIGDTHNHDDSLWAGVSFRRTSETDTMWQSGYTVYMRKNGDVDLFNPKSTPSPVLATGHVTGAEGPVKLVISMNGDRIQVFQKGNDKALIDVHDATFAEGYIGLEGSGVDVTFRDFVLSSYDGAAEAKVSTELVKNQSFKDSFDKADTRYATTGTVAVKDGAMRFENGGSAGLEGRVFTDCEIQFSFNLDGKQTAANARDYWAGLTVGKQTAYGDVFTFGGYMLTIRKNGELELLNCTGRVAHADLGKTLTGTVNARVVCSGSELEVYLNGEAAPALSAKLPDPAEGFFALNCDGGVVAFDGYSITGVRKDSAYGLLDDFSGDLSNWQKIQYADKSSIQNGKLVTKGVKVKEDKEQGILADGVSPELLYKKSTFKNLRIGFDVKIDETAMAENWAGAYFHSPGTNGFWKSGGYLVYVTNLGNLVLYKHGTGNLAEAKLPTNPAQQEIGIEVEILNGVISVFADYASEPLIRVKDSGFTEGYFGLMSDFADAQFDNVHYCVPVEAFDDFSTDSGRWNFNQTAATKVANGVLTLSGVVDGGDAGLRPDPYASVKKYEIADGFLSFDMKIIKKQKENQDFWAGCAVRTSSENGFWGNGGYLVFLDTAGNLTIYSEATQNIATAPTGINPMEDFVNIKIELKGEVMNVYVNHSAAPTLTAKNLKTLSGGICLTSDWTNAEFDNVVIQGLIPVVEQEKEAVWDEPYSDDFETDSLQWKNVNEADGTMEIAGGKLNLRGTSGANPVQAVLRERAYSNAEIEFDMTLPIMEHGWAGVAIGHSKWNTSVWAEGYFLYGGFNTKEQKTEYYLFKANAGPVANIKMDGEKGGTVHVKLVTADGKISAFFNGSETAAMTYEDAGYKGGYVTLINYMTKNTFDNFVVRKAAEGKPDPDTPVWDEPYTDDFAADTGAWVNVNQADGTVEVADGQLKLTGTSGANPVQALLANRAYSEAEFRFDMVLPDMVTSWAGMGFAHDKPTSTIWECGYFLYGGFNTNDQKTEVKLFKANVGDVAAVKLDGGAVGGIAKIRLVTANGKIEVYVNGSAQPVISYEDAGYKGGYITMLNYMGSNAFDNFEAKGVSKPDPKPELEKVDAKAPSCTEAGNVEYWTDADGRFYLQNEQGEFVEAAEKDLIVPALGHKLTHVDEVPTEVGKEGVCEHWSCERCGKLFSDEAGQKEVQREQLVIPALPEPETDPTDPQISNSIHVEFVKKGWFRDRVTRRTVQPDGSIQAPDANGLFGSGKCWKSDRGDLYIESNATVTYNELAAVFGEEVPENAVIRFTVVSENERPSEPQISNSIHVEFVKKSWFRDRVTKRTVQPDGSIQAPDANGFFGSGKCWKSDRGNLYLSSNATVTYDQLAAVFGGQVPENATIRFTVVSENERPVDPQPTVPDTTSPETEPVIPDTTEPDRPVDPRHTITVRFVIHSWFGDDKVTTITVQESASIEAPQMTGFGNRSKVWKTDDGKLVAEPGEPLTYDQLCKVANSQYIVEFEAVHR